MTELRKSSQLTNNGFYQTQEEPRKIILRVSIPDIKQERILEISSNDLLWDAKLRILQSGDVCLREHLNYGFFMSPKNGRCGKFLDDWRPGNHYSFETPLDNVEFIKKRRLYKNTGLNEMKVKRLRSKANTCEFMKAIKEHNVEEVTRFLNRGFDPNCQDPETSETPLTMAVRYSSCDQLISELYRGGAHVDYRNGGSFTALHEAVKCHNINAVKALLNLGMSPKVRDGDNLTPLYHGVSLNCSIDILSLLLFDHSPVGCVNAENGLSELHLACMGCSTAVVDLLLFYGADLNLKSRNGETCLHICARLNKTESARCLLTRGINSNILNNNGKRALEVASLCRNSETAAAIRDFDRIAINPHNEVPTRNDRRRSNLCEPRVSLSQNDLSRQGRLSSVTSAFSSLISRMKNKKPKAVGSILPNNQFLANYRSTLDTRPQSSRPFVIRTLYIVRNKRPFGFVLRGPKKRKTHDELNSLGNSLPSYHFIESVEKNSVAERAGLSINDFILEIDNRDVRCLSHTDVVSIIRRCGAEITFKVGTYVADGPQTAPHIPNIERNDASVLLKSKFTVNSLNVIPHSTGASLRTIPRNDIDQINKLFGDDSDSEETYKDSYSGYNWKKAEIPVDDVILPPPDEFCDRTFSRSSGQYCPVEPPILSNDLKDKFTYTNVHKKPPPPPPMPPLRTTSIQSATKIAGLERNESKQPSETSMSHIEELRLALQKRVYHGGSIVNKIERKHEPCWTFETKLAKPGLLTNYCGKGKAETASCLSTQAGLNSVRARMGTESKPSLYQYDSGIEVVQDYKNVGKKDDACGWLLDLHQTRGGRDSNKSDKNFIGKQTIF